MQAVEAEALQRDAFGHVCLLVIADDESELLEVARALHGNLTGTIYSDTRGGDDALYAALAPVLVRSVGRLLNDRMPTGVAVSAAMNHGGPYPATAHPGFTAVGIPASLLRFSALRCYDNVREHRLPPATRKALMLRMARAGAARLLAAELAGVAVPALDDESD